MEETLSTLDYAYRAKNIKNKPEVCVYAFFLDNILYEIFYSRASCANNEVNIFSGKPENVQGYIA